MGNPLRHQSGFSLIQVLVASAVVGVIALGLAQVLTEGRERQAYIEAKYGYINLGQDLRAELSDEKSCRQAFAGLKLKPSAGKSQSIELPILGGKLAKGRNENYSLQIDAVTVGDFQLKGPGSAPGTQKYRAGLTVEAQALRGAGPRFRTMAPIPVFMELDSSQRVVHCGSSPLNPAETCESLGGKWRKTEDRCVLATDQDSADLCQSIGGTWNAARGQCGSPKGLMTSEEMSLAKKDRFDNSCNYYFEMKSGNKLGRWTATYVQDDYIYYADAGGVVRVSADDKKRATGWYSGEVKKIIKQCPSGS